MLGKIGFTYKSPVFISHRIILLFAVCICGMIAGCWQSIAASDSVLLIYDHAIFTNASLLGLLLYSLIPFVLVHILLRWSYILVAYALLFFKMFLFGCCAYGLVIAFGQSGWLVRWLIMFSDSCTIILLIWYFARSISGTSDHAQSDHIICIVLSAMIVIFDYLIVSPFTVLLLNS